jgi:ABC-type transport system involved in cytochrome c biogenesis ATPase subunit
MSLPLLDVRELSCVRGHQPLFQGVSFVLSEGHWLHLQGANGSGKTSLLRILAGLSPADSGEVLWRGQPVAAPGSAYAAERFYMGHQLALKEELSALENLLFEAAIMGRKLSRQQAMSALAQQGRKAKNAAAPWPVCSQASFGCGCSTSLSWPWTPRRCNNWLNYLAGTSNRAVQCSIPATKA